MQMKILTEYTYDDNEYVIPAFNTLLTFSIQFLEFFEILPFTFLESPPWQLIWYVWALIWDNVFEILTTTEETTRYVHQPLYIRGGVFVMSSSDV